MSTPENLLARFLNHSNQYAKSADRVKYSAFLPNRNGNTSVYDITGLNNADVWKIGDDEVAPMRGIVRGMAELCSALVPEAGLGLNKSGSSERHFDIMGWPDESDKRRSIALQLAESAELYLK